MLFRSARVEAAAAAMRAYSLERIAASRTEPGDDLVTRLLEATVDGERLAEADVVAMITGFLFAGSETTRRQITSAVQVLADHPVEEGRLTGVGLTGDGDDTAAGHRLRTTGSATGISG